MKRKSAGVLIGLLVLGAILLSASIALAATLSWTAPTTYTDGSAIPAVDQARITYTPYTGASATGPWSARPSTSAGATSTAVPDPSPGTTLYYTLDCTLDGQTSVRAVAVSKSLPFLVPAAPSGLSVQ